MQAILLIYIAFFTIWRIAFNSDAEGGWEWFELGIDIFFTVDIVLNFHTAFYDESGDLVGVKTSGRRTSKADFKKLYYNYATGCEYFASVSPISAD